MSQYALGLVDAVNTFRVSAGTFASFRVLSPCQFRHFRRSTRFLRRVRFPAAPQKKVVRAIKLWPVFFFIDICQLTRVKQRLG
jgi:hypothetical protein